MERVGTEQALFVAVGREDFQEATKLLQGGANPNSVFEVQKDIYLSIFNLFITKVAAIGVSKGPNNSKYLACMKLMKQMVAKSVLECKCLKQHKCPLYIALEAFKITSEQDILECKCDLLRCLIINGANIKFQPGMGKGKVGKWSLKWLDLEGLRSYLITKNFKYVETKIEV